MFYVGLSLCQRVRGVPDDLRPVVLALHVPRNRMTHRVACHVPTKAILVSDVVASRADSYDCDGRRVRMLHRLSSSILRVNPQYSDPGSCNTPAAMSHPPVSGVHTV